MRIQPRCSSAVGELTVRGVNARYNCNRAQWDCGRGGGDRSYARTRPCRERNSVVHLCGDRWEAIGSGALPAGRVFILGENIEGWVESGPGLPDDLQPVAVSISTGSSPLEDDPGFLNDVFAGWELTAEWQDSQGKVSTPDCTD